MSNQDNKPSFARPADDDADSFPKRVLIQFALSRREQAVKGDPMAQYVLALGLLSKGFVEESYQWFLKSAEQGVAASMQSVGAMLLYGRGVPKDEKEAAVWFERAASEMPESKISHLIFLGESDKPHPSFEHFFAWTEQKDVLSDPVADAILAGDYRRAEELLIDRVHKDDPGGQRLLAEIYRNIGDCKRALEWYTRAAEQGHIYAQEDLSRLYADESLPIHDLKKAFDWCLRAAEEGNRECQVRVAEMYAGGIGTEMNEEESERWRRQADDELENQPLTLAESIRRKIKEMQEGKNP